MNKSKLKRRIYDVINVGIGFNIYNKKGRDIILI